MISEYGLETLAGTNFHDQDGGNKNQDADK
jgi:hypothetical protein